MVCSLQTKIALLGAGSFNARLVSLGFGRHMNTISQHNRDIIGFQTVFVGLFSILAITVSATAPLPDTGAMHQRLPTPLTSRALPALRS